MLHCIDEQKDSADQKGVEPPARFPLLSGSGPPTYGYSCRNIRSGFRKRVAEPLHMSVEDSAGTVMRLTIQQGVISYADENVVSDLRFPLRVVITDEGGNGKLVVNIDTEEIGTTGFFALRYP